MKSQRTKTADRRGRSREARGVLSEENKTRVVQATVRLTNQGGQGVLVPGGFVLTAAHCIQWNGDGSMTVFSNFMEKVKTKTGSNFTLATVAAEPVADIAVLSAPDNQEFGDDVDAFETWCEATTPVPVRTGELRVREPLSVHILTHRGRWISGTVTKWGNDYAGRVALNADTAIRGGTSGGAVVDDDGCLVGLVSWSCEQKIGGKWTGAVPVPRMALPCWAWEAITAATSMQRSR